MLAGTSFIVSPPHQRSGTPASKVGRVNGVPPPIAAGCGRAEPISCRIKSGSLPMILTLPPGLVPPNPSIHTENHCTFGLKCIFPSQCFA